MTVAVLWLVSLLFAVLPAPSDMGAVAAQDRSTDRSASVAPPGGQVGRSNTEAALPPVDQVSRPAAHVAPPIQLAPRAVRLDAPQVSVATDAAMPTAQINPTRRTAQPGQQLSAGKATADVSSPLSTPSQGRRQASERLAGRDRCDPASRSVSTDTCARVIETRSGEFVRADPLVLSPEQRLLVDQRLREAPRSATAAVDRIGRNSVDADSADAQGVASVVLGTPGTETAPPVETDPAAALPNGLGAALIEALVERAQAIPR